MFEGHIPTQPVMPIAIVNQYYMQNPYLFSLFLTCHQY
jgi:3-hydroxymyristoyl/3-hydroxydecanoyl-(acyl carrier protein) dehydratase